MAPEIEREILRYAAFTANGRGGNPAGVVLDARGLADADMLAIAADLGYSETAFVIEPLDESGRARVRYFAPLQEVPFCGHATIATAAAMAERGAPAELTFQTEAGPVDVRTARSARRCHGRADQCRPRRRGGPTRPGVRRPCGPAMVVRGPGSRLAGVGGRCGGPPPRARDPEPAAARGPGLRLRPAGGADEAREPDHPPADLAGVADAITTRATRSRAVAWSRTRPPGPPPPRSVATSGTSARWPATAEFTISQGVDMGAPSELTVRLVPGDPRIRVRGYARPLALPSA